MIMSPRLTLLVAFAALAACASDPKPETARSVQAMPAQFAPASVDQAVAPDTQWWRALGDPTLDRLVDLALTNNRDLLAAEADVRRARALAGVEGWRMLPSANISAGSGRARDVNPVVEADFAEAGADVAWELDVFGRLRANARAAGRDALSVAEAERGARVAVAAETAADYIALRGAQARLASARSNAEAQSQTLQRTEALHDAGRSNPLDVARAREQYETTAAQVADIEGQVAAARNAIDVLVAGFPDDLDLTAAAPVPTPPAQFGVGAPEDLLQRRPDIRRARAILEAATARTRAAQVDWWPRISLLGSATWSGADFASVGTSAGLSFIVGPRIDWPALDIRRNALRVEAAHANAEAQFYRYDQVVFAAVRDVDTAMSNLDAATRLTAGLERAAAAAREAARVSRLRYQEGMEAFFNVLDAERRVYEAEDRLAIARTRRAVAYIRLGQALGVGWAASPS